MLVSQTKEMNELFNQSSTNTAAMTLLETIQYFDMLPSAKTRTTVKRNFKIFPSKEIPDILRRITKPQLFYRVPYLTTSGFLFPMAATCLMTSFFVIIPVTRLTKTRKKQNGLSRVRIPGIICTCMDNRAQVQLS